MAGAEPWRAAGQPRASMQTKARPAPSAVRRSRPQAARTPRPGAGPEAARSTRPGARGNRMPARPRLQTHGARGCPHTRPPGPGRPVSVVRISQPSGPQSAGSLVDPEPRFSRRLQTPGPRGPEASARRPALQLQSGAPGARRRKIAFADELPPHTPPSPRKPRPPSLPDYELKYPPVSSEKARSRYVAVFQDQYAEFLELQQEVQATQDKLQQLEALLMSLPFPRSQKEAQVAARVRREMEKKRMDPGFLDKQARCRYLKGKLRHLKSQIRKFDDQGDSEGSVYF